jgi:hypothetical protein
MLETIALPQHDGFFVVTERNERVGCDAGMKVLAERANCDIVCCGAGVSCWHIAEATAAGRRVRLLRYCGHRLRGSNLHEIPAA